MKKIVLFFVAVLTALVFTGCGNNAKIKLVQDGCLALDTSKTVGEVLNSKIDSQKWQVISVDTPPDVVEVTGVWKGDEYDSYLKEIKLTEQSLNEKQIALEVQDDLLKGLEKMTKKYQVASRNKLSAAHGKLFSARNDYNNFLRRNIVVANLLPVKGNIVKLRFKITGKDQFEFQNGEFYTAPDKVKKYTYGGETYEATVDFFGVESLANIIYYKGPARFTGEKNMLYSIRATLSRIPKRF